MSNPTTVLNAGETTQFELAPSAFAIVTNSIVVIDGITSVVTSAQQFGPYVSTGPNTGGNSLRVIGSVGGGTCTIVDNAYDDRAYLHRDSSGAINGLIDPKTGAVVSLSDLTGGVSVDSFNTLSGTVGGLSSSVATAASAAEAATAAAQAASQAAASKAPQSALDSLATTVAAKASIAQLATINGNPITAGGNIVIPTGTGGTADAVRQAFSNPMALSTKGAGAAAPAVEGNLISVNADLAVTFTGKTTGATLSLDFVSTGVGAVTFPGCQVYGSFTVESGRKSTALVTQSVAGTIVGWLNGDLIDITPPAIQTPHIENASRVTILTPIVDTGTITMLGALTDLTLGGADAGSFTKVSQSYAAGVHSLVLSGPANSTTQLTLAFGAGFFRDDATPTANLSLAKSATAVTNNLTISAPSAATISPGAITASSVSVTIAAGAVDGNHGAAATFTLQTRAGGTTGAFTDVGAPSSATTQSETGMAASTSVDLRVMSNNAGGSTASNIITMSSAAASGALRFAIAGTSVESGSSPNWRYDNSLSPAFDYVGDPSAHLPLGTATLRFKIESIADTNGHVEMFLSTVATGNDSQSGTNLIDLAFSVGDTAFGYQSSDGQSYAAGIVPAVGGLIEWRKTATTMDVYASTDNGGTWTALGGYSGFTDRVLYPKLVLRGSGGSTGVVTSGVSIAASSGLA